MLSKWDSLSLSKKVIMFATPLTIALVGITHPVHYGMTDVYEKLVPHVDWWIIIHVLQLFLFGFLGLINYWLVEGIDSFVSMVSRIATGFFIIFYNAFDSLVGLGNGILIKYTSQLTGSEKGILIKAIDAFWVDNVALLITGLAVSSWLVAILTAVIARAETTNKNWRLRILAILAFLYGFLSIPLGITSDFYWWIGLIIIGILVSITTKSGLANSFLVVAAILFACSHTLPFGPPAMICFMFGIWSLEVVQKKKKSITRLTVKRFSS